MKLKSSRESMVEMTELVLPNDTNMLGNLLGGKLLHLVDIAGAMAAQRHCNKIVATAAIDSVEFKHPVKAGEIITLQARVTWVGRTSMEVAVEVFSENFMTGERKFTNKAYLTFVAVDAGGKPAEVCGLLVETDEDRAEYEAASERRCERLKKKQSAGR